MMTRYSIIFSDVNKQNCSIHSSFRTNAFVILIVLTVCLRDLFVMGFVEAVESTPVINTSTGPIRGEVLTTVAKLVKYSSFRSIRYAESTSGYRRFKPPVAVKPWTKIVEATVEANACPQFNLITLNYTGTEDCLFINVFTPLIKFDNIRGSGKAVMVWIYGGSFISGNAKSTLYGPDFLIEDDIILVTFNYRVGPFGFLNLHHQNATGNAGLKDQVLALKWVKKNIKKFGGDAERITIFGNSAGAALVDLHTLSESSQGLFHRAITMSGSLFNSWAIHTTKEAVNQSFALGSLLGVSTTKKDILLKKLYEATPYEIAMATAKLDKISPPFRPTIEDPSFAGNHAFLVDTPLSKYKIGNFTKVPHMTGYTAKETSYWFTHDTIKPITNLVNSASATIDKIILEITEPLSKNLFVTLQSSLQKIPNATLNDYIDKTTFEYFKAGIDLKQRFLNDQSHEPVYYYQLSFNPSESLHELLYHVISNGTAHGDELAYLFYMPIVDLPLDEEHTVSITRRRMVRMWTNFAKYGNPTPDESDPILHIIWPTSGSSGVHLEINKELFVGPRPVDTRDKYLDLIK